MRPFVLAASEAGLLMSYQRLWGFFRSSDPRALARRKRLLPLRQLALALAIGCTDQTDQTWITPLWPARTTSAQFVPTKCWFSPPASRDAECGYVTVPDDGERDGAVRIATMILHGSAGPEDPVVFLQGGPGAPAIAAAAAKAFALAPVLAQRDLVLIDQRGTGLSDPALQCLSTDGSPAGCHARLTALGHNLGSYNSRQNAKDIDAVRQALGYDGWTLYGSSYGTRLALTVARDFGAGVNAMILDGVVPLQVDALADSAGTFADSFAALDSACARQRDCAGNNGPLAPAFFAAVDRTKSSPALVPFAVGIEVPVNDVALVSAVRQLLSDGRTIPYLPDLVTRFAAGDLSFLGRYFGAQPPSDKAFANVALGMYYSVTCQDDATFTTQERIAAAIERVDPHFALAFDAPGLLKLCEKWPVPRAPDSENLAVATDIPTLLISGAFDPLTPPRFAALAARTLSDAVEVVLPDQGHGASFSACGTQVVLNFLSGDRPPQATECLDQIAPTFSDPALELPPPNEMQ